MTEWKPVPVVIENDPYRQNTTNYTAGDASSAAYVPTGTAYSRSTKTVKTYGAGEQYTPDPALANYDTAARAQELKPDYGLNYTPDAAGQAYTEAMTKIGRDLGDKPTYDGKYDAEMDAAYRAIANRDPFRWNAQDDEFYRDYEQRYTDLGRKAMKDTIGQAAMLTGGYSNSYGQYVGQAAYNDWMDALMDKSVELEERAYQRWRDAGTEMYNQFSLLSSLRDNDYGMYRDSVSDYNYNLALLQAYEAENYSRAQYANQLNMEAEQQGYARARDELSDLRYNDELAYERWRNSIEDTRYEEELAYARQRDAIADQQWQAEMDYKYANMNSGGSGGRSGGGSGSGSYGASNAYNDWLTTPTVIGYDGYTGQAIYGTPEDQYDQGYGYQQSLIDQYVTTAPKTTTTAAASTTKKKDEDIKVRGGRIMA